MFFIIEEAKGTILGFYQGTVLNIVNLFSFNIKLIDNDSI